MYVTVSFLSKLFLLPAKNCIASISVESSRLSASSARITKIFGIYRYLETQSSPSEELVTDERLCQLLADIENSQRSTGEICATHVDRLCKEGLHSTAARLLCKLPDKGIPPSLKAYNVLLSASGRENNVEVSSWVFKEIVVSYDTVPTAAYLSFAKAFINTNDHTHLLRVVKEVSELIPGPRRTVLINRLIFAFSECKQFDKALLIFDELKNLNCIPDLITYNTVLDVFGCAGQVDEMLLLFVSMKENGITPDLIAYNTLLNHMRKAGRLDLCLTYFKEMIEHGIEPDLLTYTALIGSLGKSGKIEELLCAFDEMEAKMIRPSIYVYRATVNRLKKMGKVELAAAFSEKMNASLPNLAGPNDFKRKGQK